MNEEVKCLKVIQRYPNSEGKVNLYNSCNVTSNIQILINDRSSMTRYVSAQTPNTLRLSTSINAT